MLFRYYLLSLLALLVAFGLLAQFLPFVTHSHVSGSTVVEETFSGEAIFNITEEQFASVQARLPALMLEYTSFEGTGAVHLVSGRLEILNSTFTRNSKHGSYSIPAVAHVQWTGLPVSMEGEEQGAVEIRYGPMESKYGFFARFEGAGSSSGVLRHVTVHGSGLALFGARLWFGLAVGLPIIFTMHTVWWIFVVRRERRKQIAGMMPPSPLTLPVTFYAEPVFEWRIFTVMMLLFSLVSLLTLYVGRGGIAGQPPPPSFLILGAGVAVSTGLMWLVRRNAVTVQVDLRKLSYVRGRGSKEWITGDWADLRAVRIRTATDKGLTYEWVEIEFPEGQKCPIYPRTILDYPLVRETLRAMFAKHHGK